LKDPQITQITQIKRGFRHGLVANVGAPSLNARFGCNLLNLRNPPPLRYGATGSAAASLWRDRFGVISPRRISGLRILNLDFGSTLFSLRLRVPARSRSITLVLFHLCSRRPVVWYGPGPVMSQSLGTRNTEPAADSLTKPDNQSGNGTRSAKPTYVVDAEKLLSSHPKELWKFRELYLLLVKRDFVASYKQTLLGPLWFFIQPFLASVVFMVVFGRIARLPTTQLPPLVFYMSGIIAWSFFSNCVSQVSTTFIGSGGIFRKIYFPRLIVPLSQISMNFLNFLAQLLVLFAVIGYFQLTGSKIEIGPKILALPGVLLAMALLALGIGCLIAAGTVKYRDLNILVAYTLNLWMFGSFVIYPRSLVPDNLQWLMNLNPMASFIECYRSSLFGAEHAQIQPAIMACCMTVVVLVAGLWCFIRAEGTFTDSI
jgi:lipopolysaccharide transport system permease protein